MSLRIWLPLNGSLENKGLDDITPVLTGAVAVDNEGKIGKCYKFGTSLGRITIPPTIMRNYAECSVTFWVNILGWQSNWDTFFQAGLGTAPWNSYIFGVLRNLGNCVVFTISDASSSSQGNYKSSDLNLNTWYHLGFTYKSGHCCIYVNGQLYKDYSTTIIPNFSGINYISLGQLGNASNYQTNCKLNDFRIYDHALSPLEVKHIAQGLILHYPLSDKYLEDTTNLVTGITAGGQTTVNNNVVTTSGVDKDTYFTINLSENIVVGTQYTFSCDAEIPSGTWRFPLGNQNNTTLDFVLHNGHNVYSFVANDTSWGTKRIFMDDMGGATNSARSTGLKTKIYNFQLEKKDHETGFAGYGVSRTNTIVYDTSGYGNNGEIYAYDSDGKIEVGSDTPRYSISTHVISSNTATSSAAGTTYLYGHCQLTNPSQMTVAFWCKPIKGYNNTTTQGQFCTTTSEFNSQSVGSDYQYSAMNHRDGTVDINDSSSTAQCRPHINFIPNEWHHYVIIYDGQNGSTYQDGVLYEVKSFESPKQLDSFIGIVIGFSKAGGVWRKNDSYYSDFRIYATALSADDIKSLYQNSAYIDNHGNVYGAVYEEV